MSTELGICGTGTGTRAGARAMTKARYTVMNGLPGCMPDNSGTYEFRTRRELANFIREQIERLDWPANKFADVNLRRLWSAIARHGSSSVHFRIQHKNYELTFNGLTDAEYAEAIKDEENA